MLSTLRSLLTGEAMTDDQYEYQSFTAREVGDLITTSSHCLYRVLAVGPVRPKPFGQTILVERVNVRTRRRVVRS